MEVVAAFSRDHCIAGVLDQRRKEVIEGGWQLPAVHTCAVVDAEENYSGHQDEALMRQRQWCQGVAVIIRRLTLQDLRQRLA